MNYNLQNRMSRKNKNISRWRHVWKKHSGTDMKGSHWELIQCLDNSSTQALNTLWIYKMYWWHRKGELVCTNHWSSFFIWAFLFWYTSIKIINKPITFLTTVDGIFFLCFKIHVVRFITEPKEPFFIAISKSLFHAIDNSYFSNVNYFQFQHYIFHWHIKSQIFPFTIKLRTQIKTAQTIYHSQQKSTSVFQSIWMKNNWIMKDNDFENDTQCISTHYI